MFSTANTHTLYTNRSKAISVHSSLPVNKPRFPELKDSETHEIKTLRLKTAHEKNKKASCKNTSSDVLRLMGSLGFTITPDIYSSLIEECTHKRDPNRARELWKHMKNNKPMMRYLSQPNRFIFLNRILIMFMSCGIIDDAHQLFGRMLTRDASSWCLMIAGLVDNSLHHEALDLFSQMMIHPINLQNDDLLQILFVCVLKACINDINIDLGKALHGWAIKLGYTSNLHISTAFLDFYAKFRCSEETHLIFNNKIQEGDTVFWTSAMVSNCHENRFKETIDMFKEMGRVGVRKNEFTLSTVLKACGGINDGGYSGQQVHGDAIKRGLVECNVFVMCGLVDMYCKNGDLRGGRRVFDSMSCEMRDRNSACWNAMINGYLVNEEYVEAIKILYKMKSVGLDPKESLVERVRLVCGTNRFKS